jgi:hypothetical protein
MNFNTMLSFETATKNKMHGRFILSLPVVSVLLLELVRIPGGKLMYWAIAGSLLVGLPWCLNLNLQVGDFFFITDCLKHLFVWWALWSTLLILFQSQGLSILCIREAGCYCFPSAPLLLSGVSETHSDLHSCEEALRTSALVM